MACDPWTMRTSGRLPLTAPALALGALLLGVVGCTPSTPPSAPEESETATLTETPTPADVSTAEPSDPEESTLAPTSDPVPGIDLDDLDDTIDAGTVADGEPNTVSGSGSAIITIEAEGGIATVAEVDCTSCTGGLLLTSTDRQQPWGQLEAPTSASYLLGLLEGDDELDLVIVAEGDWTVTFLSWNDLEPVTGEQSGTGSTVFWLAEDAPGFEFSYTPEASGESVQVRAISAVETTDQGPAAELFGDSEAFTESIELQLPAVVSIMTDTGSWTLTPE